jgi:hypothetical protein
MLKIHQIILTNAQVKEVNTSETCPDFYLAYLDSTMAKIDKAQDLGMYKHVADVSTDDKEVAFMAMNRWSAVDQKLVRKHGKCHSLSVGDIVEADDGTKWVCATCGWNQLAA